MRSKVEILFRVCLGIIGAFACGYGAFILDSIGQIHIAFLLLAGLTLTFLSLYT